MLELGFCPNVVKFSLAPGYMRIFSWSKPNLSMLIVGCSFYYASELRFS